MVRERGPGRFRSEVPEKVLEQGSREIPERGTDSRGLDAKRFEVASFGPEFQAKCFEVGIWVCASQGRLRNFAARVSGLEKLYDWFRTLGAEL